MTAIYGIMAVVMQIMNLCRHPVNGAAWTLAASSTAIIVTTVAAKHWR